MTDTRDPTAPDPCDSKPPAIGDRVYFRDLEAGELCERFDRLFLVTGTTIRDEVTTYRGEGKSFI